MPPLTEPIARIGFFAGIDPKLLKKVAESAVVCDYEKGQVIVKEGETGLGMYVVLRGRVAVTRHRNGAAVRLAELGPEQCFAETSLIDEKPRSDTATALQETECLLFTRESFLALMSKNPQLAIRLARSLAERLRMTDEPGRVPPRHDARAIANGAASPALEGTRKAAIQQRLLSMFEWLYTAKAFTRFSVALLGCPVEGIAANLIEEIRVGEVKALILPADEAVDVRIEAYAEGSFGLHLFTPESPSPIRFEPVRIQAGDRFVFSLAAGHGADSNCSARLRRDSTPSTSRSIS